MHGGSISVESEVAWVVFEIRLPKLPVRSVSHAL
jgi:signal transduction histidine kinase